MGTPAVVLPKRWSLAKALHRIGFVDEDIAVSAVIDQRLRGRGVAGNHDDAVGRIEPEAEGVGHVFMLRGKRRDRDVVVLVDDA